MDTKIGINLLNMPNYSLLNTKMEKEARQTIKNTIGQEELDNLLLATSKIPAFPITISTCRNKSGSYMIDVIIPYLEGELRKTLAISNFEELRGWLKEVKDLLIYSFPGI